MDETNIDKNLKTISNGMRYFHNICQLLVLAAILRVIGGAMSLYRGGPDSIESSIPDFIAAGGYAIIAVGFYYLRRLFDAVRNVVEELRTTV
ncbi:MAG TPA: hypothetical protein VK698_21275 [Kofleriaceae bacterium]|nr:hypothetical protein [Kofleriaceae bacterium]